MHDHRNPNTLIVAAVAGIVVLAAFGFPCCPTYR